jgi:hypothetical protein
VFVEHTPYWGGTFGQAPSLLAIIGLALKMFAINKHTSLFCCSNSYEENKSFVTNDDAQQTGLLVEHNKV